MAWFKTDDKLPDHRKARAVRKSHPSKRRDAAPFGLWALAGAWSSDGFVPLEILEDWDDDAFELAERLVAAGMWHPTERAGEPGYVFHDWHDHNPARDDNDPSSTGTFGNHVRWHVQRKMVDPNCDHCPSGPDDVSADDRGDIGPTEPDVVRDDLVYTSEAIGRPDIGRSHALSADDRPDIGPLRPESLPSRPVPTRPDPNPSPSRAATPSLATERLERFDEFWNTYGKKVDRKKSEQRWVVALGKPGVTADLLIGAAAAYVLYERQENQGGKFIMDPSRWLLNERWRDERPALLAPQTRVQEHLALVRNLAEREQGGSWPQIGGAS